jgi:hypothetical protein
MRTKHRISLLEKYQREELVHRDIVCRRLLNLENKKETNEMVGVITYAINSMRSELQKALHRISPLEEMNRKLRAAVSNTIPPP